MWNEYKGRGQEMNRISEIIKAYRKRKGLRQDELAEKCGYSLPYISALERSPEGTSIVPSEKILRKIAEVLSNNDTEKAELTRLLLIERSKMIVPKEIADEFFPDTDEIMKPKIDMTKLIKRVEKDMKKVRFFRSTKARIPDHRFRAFLRGEVILTKKEVIALATVLEQPVNHYLALAGYIDPEVSELLKERRVSYLFSKVSDLDPEDIEYVISLMELVIKRLTRDKKSKDNSELNVKNE